ncbi:hypothetical protein [Methylacidimicrobium tartarophylax]|uniref:Uncharacterized protein n=1 Tax=Methylacidimicrobium tartarophylax TaxID=1041768 RepID=A0A5E6MJM0_9BACT|nr:hypothetical protein [Methylacidimicrobium tartarophylax]VVM05712.1 hypothetical protein MAMT_00749 [Methylacidimicrobium tartarophylax]
MMPWKVQRREALIPPFFDGLPCRNMVRNSVVARRVVSLLAEQPVF